jgi:hypothetical protein
MLSPALASATLSQIVRPSKVDDVHKPFKKWHKFADISSGQNSFEAILGQAERKMRQVDPVELMTLTSWNRHFARPLS